MVYEGFNILSGVIFKDLGESFNKFIFLAIFLVLPKLGKDGIKVSEDLLGIVIISPHSKFSKDYIDDDSLISIISLISAVEPEPEHEAVKLLNIL